MSTNVHFINVGQGNMTLIICDNGATILYDCNVTDKSRKNVFDYLNKVIPGKGIDVFVNSHRDCDHLRGIAEIHSKYPIKQIWDSGETGTSPEDPVYVSYMNLKRNVSSKVPSIGESWNAGVSQIKCLNSYRRNYSDPHSQCIVLRVDNGGSSVMLTSDTDAEIWKNAIMPSFANQAPSNILVASHHGSISYFDIPSDKYYYTDHIGKINAQMTIVSVGDNVHGHPDLQAIKLYEKYSRGSKEGNKIARTDINGNIMLELKGEGAWSLHYNQ